MKEFELEVQIKGSKEAVWDAITDFASYPKWNSLLKMENNDSLKIGQQFEVTIIKPASKNSTFKAMTISKNVGQGFVAVQKIIGKWFLQATHYFIIKEIDKKHVSFKQKWELTGIMAALFEKQIFNELALFDTMNNELKAFIEKSDD